MKALVLGSSGQIGSALVDYLRQQYVDVILFDILNGWKQDIRNENSQLVLDMASADFVFFLAFDVGGSKYLKQYQNTFGFIDNNVQIMKNVFDVLCGFKIPFIFASSQMSNMVESPYGVLKALGEHYTRSLNGLFVKFWNVYGVEKDLKKSHVITDLILKAKNGRIDVDSSGEEERQFLYSVDCCEALYTLAQRYNEVSRDYTLDVTSFKWTSIKTVAEIISNEFGGVPVTFGSNKDIQYIKNEPLYDIFAYWSPHTPIDVGIREIIKYYESHS